MLLKGIYQHICNNLLVVLVLLIFVLILILVRVLLIFVRIILISVVRIVLILVVRIVLIFVLVHLRAPPLTLLWSVRMFFIQFAKEFIIWKDYLILVR